MLQTDVYSLCDQCGQPYVNFCVRCAKVAREEAVEKLMETYGLTLDNLVSKLSDQILEGNFGALKLAIEMRSMKPAAKSEVIQSQGSIDQEAKDRISKKLKAVSNE